MVDLKEWAIEYIKHKDAFKQQIVDIMVHDDNLVVRYKDKEELVLICPELSQSFSRLDKYSYVSVFTFNTQSNFNELIERWHQLTSIEGLTIYFTNPDSSTDTKWIIRPNLHNKIADEDSLKTGLFDILGHLDIYRRYGEAFFGLEIHTLWEAHIDELSKIMKAHGVGYEVNTSSLRRGLSEPMPERVIVKALHERGVNTVTVGSDAHRPTDVGGRITDALNLLQSNGIHELAVFNKRRSKNCIKRILRFRLNHP